MNKRTVRWMVTSAFVVFFFLLLYGIQLAENGAENSSIHNFWDALWYALVTLTTVGYGDSYPVTVAGKILGLVLILLSLGLLSYIIGNISSKINAYMERKKLGLHGTDFTHHVVILGWNELGRLIIDQVVQANHKVVIVSESKEHIEMINQTYERDVLGIFGKPNSIESLEKANLNEATSVYLNADDDSGSLVALINLRQYNQKISTVVMLSNMELKETFLNAGASYVIPEREISSKLVASFLFEPEVATYTEDLITTADDNAATFDMQQYFVKEENPFCGKSFMEALVGLKKEYNSILVGLGQLTGSDYNLVKNPPESALIQPGDYLIVIANGVGQKLMEKEFKVRQGRLER